MFDIISFSIPRLYTLAVRVNHFRKSTVTLNTSFDLTVIPVFQHSIHLSYLSTNNTHEHKIRLDIYNSYCTALEETL